MVGYGRNPYQAVQDFRSSLQRAISCVTPSVIVVRSATGYSVGLEHALTLGVPEAVKLSGADIAFSVRAYARVVERDGGSPWRVDLVSYFYTLRDAQAQEVIAYHGHPGRRSPIDFPHLHLGAGSRVGREELEKAHVPTGRVELEDVLALVIREFGVRPHREDWAEILGP
ncbi:MAG: hypothetical protein ACRDTR_09605 [Rubrobacter sp.]